MQYSYILNRLVSKLLNIMNRKNQHTVFYLLYFLQYPPCIETVNVPEDLSCCHGTSFSVFA